MRFVVKTYVEKHFGNKDVVSRKINLVVENRNPANIEKEEDLLKFRFYDKEVLEKDDGSIETLRKFCYSPWYCNGTRITKNTIFDNLNDESLQNDFDTVLDIMHTYDVDEVCLTQNGKFIFIGENDLTIEELIKRDDIDICLSLKKGNTK